MSAQKVHKNGQRLPSSLMPLLKGFMPSLVFSTILSLLLTLCSLTTVFLTLSSFLSLSVVWTKSKIEETRIPEEIPSEKWRDEEEFIAIIIPFDSIFPYPLSKCITIFLYFISIASTSLLKHPVNSNKSFPYAFSSIGSFFFCWRFRSFLLSSMVIAFIWSVRLQSEYYLHVGSNSSL